MTWSKKQIEENKVYDIAQMMKEYVDTAINGI